MAWMDAEATSKEVSIKLFFLQEMQAFLRYEDLSGAGPEDVYLPGLMIPAHATFAAVVHDRPSLVKRRSVFVDLLGGGFSDAPEGFGYSLEEHRAQSRDCPMSLR
jgi:hypothetical protein